MTPPDPAGLPAVGEGICKQMQVRLLDVVKDTKHHYNPLPSRHDADTILISNGVVAHVISQSQQTTLPGHIEQFPLQ